jgi:ankyrin repeat protein
MHDTRQSKIIEVFNQYIKELPQSKEQHTDRLFFNEEGICLPLVLSYLNHKFYYETDPNYRSIFEVILELLANQEELKKFFDYEKNLLERKKELTKSSKGEQEQYVRDVRNYWDQRALIDLALAYYQDGRYSEVRKNFFIIGMVPQLYTEGLAYAGLEDYACIGMTFNSKDFLRFFKIGDDLCPFVSGGHYVIGLPRHVIALSVNKYDQIEAYDPNQGKPTLNIKKDFLDFLYQNFSSKNLIKVSVLAVRPKIINKRMDQQQLIKLINRNHFKYREQDIINRMKRTAYFWLESNRKGTLEEHYYGNTLDSLFLNTEHEFYQYLDSLIQDSDRKSNSIFSKTKEAARILGEVIGAARQTGNLTYLGLLLKTKSLNMNVHIYEHSPLEYCFFTYDFKTARFLLENGKQVYHLDFSFLSYLNDRINHHDFELINYLKPYINKKVFLAPKGHSALEYAIERKLEGLVNFLINDPASDLNEHCGVTPLIRAILKCDEAIVIRLVQDERTDLNLAPSLNAPIEYLMNNQSCQKFIPLFLENDRFDINRPIKGLTPLELAIMKEDIGLLDLLLASEKIQTAFSTVIIDSLEDNFSEGKTEFINYLITHPKTYLNFHKGSGVLLIEDQVSRLQSMVQLLIGSPDSENYCYQPFIDAIRRKQTYRVGMMIDYPGLNINLSDRRGKTPLMHTLDAGNSTMAKIIFNHPKLKLSGEDEKAIVNFCLKNIASRDFISPVVELLTQHKITANIDFFQDCDPVILMKILHQSQRELGKKMILHDLIQRSPGFVQDLLTLLIDKIVHLKVITLITQTVAQLQNDLRIMVQTLKDIRHLHENIVLPPSFHRIYERIQKEESASVQKAIKWIQIFIDKQRLSTEHREMMINRDQRNSELSPVTPVHANSSSLSSYVRFIPALFARAVGF